VRRALLPAALLLALLSAACASPGRETASRPASPPAPPEPLHIVVLLPEPDGKTGRVTVSNAAGARTLDRAGHATRTLDAATAPTEPEVLGADEIRALFGDALDAQPAPALHFTLYFEQASTELTADSRREVSAVLAAIRQRASVDTSVIGHTDTAGDARANEELALGRATAIGALLVAGGVDPDALDITSHGETNPLVPTGDNVVEPRNRRVEVTVR
jgi:outer membrane protein OmpA-like peptidoglycan-associated protein